MGEKLAGLDLNGTEPRKRARTELKIIEPNQNICKPMAPRPPALEGRILVLKRKYFDMMLRGEKVFEIRHMRLSRGVWHVGHSQQFFGMLELGEGILMTSEQQWHALRDAHQHPSMTRPYKKTWALPARNPPPFMSAIGYKHRQGSVGTARFEPRRSQ